MDDSKQIENKLTCTCGNEHTFKFSEDDCMMPDTIARCKQCEKYYNVFFDSCSTVKILELDADKAKSIIENESMSIVQTQF